ncbi:MAG TPA: hypothetical protein VHB21_03415 [Minicystis sp.]|nr:hypothetical protein [Minicystis sp.]
MTRTTGSPAAFAMAVALAAALSAPAARADEPAPAPSSAPAPAPKKADDAHAGRRTAGIVLVSIAGGSLGVGTTLLLADVLTASTPIAPAGLDPGIGGGRGRAGEATAGDAHLKAKIGAVLVGAGALVLPVGIVLLTLPRDDAKEEQKPAARVEPIVGPAFGGLRVVF